MNSLLTKQCTHCLETKPLTDFSPDKSTRIGRRGRCKKCCAAAERTRRAANPEKHRASAKRYREANREKCIEDCREYRRKNPGKAAADSKRWREENPKASVESQRKYRHANKEKRYATYLKWQAENMERVREIGREGYWRNREVRLERVRRHRLNNPMAVRATAHKMRARRSRVKGAHTAADLSKQYDTQRGRCWWCGKHVGDTYHVDHVIPISRGGSNNPENLVIACPSCNMRKHARLPHEWNGRLL